MVYTFGSFQMYRPNLNVYTLNRWSINMLKWLLWSNKCGVIVKYFRKILMIKIRDIFEHPVQVAAYMAWTICEDNFSQLTEKRSCPSRGHVKFGLFLPIFARCAYWTHLKEKGCVTTEHNTTMKLKVDPLW